MAKQVTIVDLTAGAGLLAANANVIMQLARPGVGYGVVESTVESGQVMRHPWKRLRTTVTYLAVATAGTDEERAAFRRAVNGQHRAVKSGADSPVAYNAFDVDLQLWVAACLYRGVMDVGRFLYPNADVTADDEIYQDAARLGTTLQVPQDRWPADRAEFERYWKESLDRILIDEPVRTYLDGLTRQAFLPWPLRVVGGRINRFFTIGFLPEEFREQMRYEWSPQQQRRFDAALRAVALVNRVLPRPIRMFPGNAFLWDMRKRLKSNRPLV
ncbi:oxygenase MpaB family protein [Antrihabitans cavernicola]|uniref:DUF2236 domain-containing protein n=1 Tax=Antrihabitans cavernicola TaxID=2495913 RepID=A0A5A7SBX9_9NOCA|nr:oxygenase MpaB family protein [Spelaeibacter cavernicola]KAA0021741.1 DUF2236 domain-containing protein [Spelaeibacter cavernicola]